jgi:hypothetical protein
LVEAVHGDRPVIFFEYGNEIEAIVVSTVVNAGKGRCCVIPGEQMTYVSDYFAVSPA